MTGNDERRGYINHLIVKLEYRKNGIGKCGKKSKKGQN